MVLLNNKKRKSFAFKGFLQSVEKGIFDKNSKTTEVGDLLEER